MESWRRELYHHGIKGQKWGVRNGPPYPLKAGDHSASEKKAGWQKSLSGNANPRPQKKKKDRLINKVAKTAMVLTEVGTRAGIELNNRGVRKAFGMSLGSQQVKYYGDVGRSAVKALSDIWSVDSSNIDKHIEKATKAVAIATDAKNKAKLTYTSHSFRRSLGLPPSSADILYYADTIREAADDIGKLYSTRSGRFNSTKVDKNKLRKTISSPKESAELHENGSSFVADFMSAISPRIRQDTERTKDYSITNKDGKKIGNMTTTIEDDGTTMNGVWLGISKKYRGNGYAQSALRLALDDARKQGMKAFTLEVPGNSPDARHIYEKMGFRETKDALIGDEDDVWGGLTKMRLEL